MLTNIVQSYDAYGSGDGYDTADGYESADDYSSYDAYDASAASGPFHLQVNVGSDYRFNRNYATVYNPTDKAGLVTLFTGSNISTATKFRIDGKQRLVIDSSADSGAGTIAVIKSSNVIPDVTNQFAVQFLTQAKVKKSGSKAVPCSLNKDKTLKCGKKGLRVFSVCHPNWLYMGTPKGMTNANVKYNWACRNASLVAISA